MIDVRYHLTSSTEGLPIVYVRCILFFSFWQKWHIGKMKILHCVQVWFTAEYVKLVRYLVGIFEGGENTFKYQKWCALYSTMIILLLRKEKEVHLYTNFYIR